MTGRFFFKKDEPEWVALSVLRKSKTMPRQHAPSCRVRCNDYKVADRPKKGKTVKCEPLRHMLRAGGKANVRLNMPGHLDRSFPNRGFMIFLRSKPRNFVHSVGAN